MCLYFQVFWGKRYAISLVFAIRAVPVCVSDNSGVIPMGRFDYITKQIYSEADAIYPGLLDVW